jgi:hypothetical protein
LNRRFAAVGLIDRVVETVPIFSLDYGELVTYGLNLAQAADELAAAARIDRQRAQQLIDALELASRDRTFAPTAGTSSHAAWLQPRPSQVNLKAETLTG